MNKSGIIGAIVLGLVGAGVAGSFIIKAQVKTSLDEALNTAKSTNAFKALTYDNAHIDLFNNTVILSNLKADMDLAQIADVLGTSMPQQSITGTASSTYETTILTGVWNLITGGQTIAKLEGLNGTMSMNMVQTIDNAKGTNTVASQVTGTIARANVQGLDISSLFAEDTTLQQLMILPAASYSMEDMIFTIKMDVKSDNAATQRPTVNIEYKIPHAYAKNIKTDFIGLMSLQNLEMNISPLQPNTPPVKINVGEVRISDLKLEDMIPVKMTYAIENMVFDTSELKDPTLVGMMGLLGLDEINISTTLAYDADMAARTFSLDPFKFGLKNVGAFEVSVDLRGLPTSEELQALQTLETSAKMEEALIDQTFESLMDKLAIKSISLGYQDEGGLKKFITAQAKQRAKGNVQALAKAYAQQAAKIVQATHGPQKAKAVRTTLVAFFADPTKIKIALKSTEPVLFSDLNTAFKVAGPMALKAFDLNVTSP